MNLSNNTKLIIGIAVAAGIGIAAAMILAPEKTSHFRKKINHSLDELGEKVNELLGNADRNLSGNGALPKRHGTNGSRSGHPAQRR